VGVIVDVRAGVPVAAGVDVSAGIGVGVTSKATTSLNEQDVKIKAKVRLQIIFFMAMDPVKLYTDKNSFLKK
jgi:hypothetical protein